MNHLISFIVLSTFISLTFAGQCNYVEKDPYNFICLFSSDANEIFEISGDLPNGVSKNLVKIVEGDEAKRNRLNVLNSVFIDKFSNLKKLNLMNFQIRNVTVDAFTSSSFLMELDLSRNSLKNISLSSPFLKVLNLAHNPILNITNSTFINLPTLSYLDMTNCSIISIHAQSFNNSSLLEYVNLQLNQLRSFNFSVFHNAQHTTREIILSHNLITHLEITRHIELLRLEKLDLSNNYLQEFPMVVIREFINLRELNLAGNRIKILSFNSHSLHLLMTLDVSCNQIFAIDANFVRSFPTIINFIAKNNPCINENMHSDLNRCFEAYKELTENRGSWSNLWLVLLIIGYGFLMSIVITGIIYLIIALIAKKNIKKKPERQVASAPIKEETKEERMHNFEQQTPPPAYREHIDHGNQSVFP
ncbi:hypothetical protein PVAND_014428 [Polypedilum vanderplanki]|uniref:Uncharacterized protein n=1 Tax=Polypedilum vanderplanki TaxID=319348 RepID=A0A9J6B9R7_POLVA|nr:hypothetical protein PVAND_014428 [Polypedilum vanderplanki]